MKDNNSPILVTGCHRSGTTWIGKTISQHSKVRYVQEPFHVHYPDEIVSLKLDTWFTHFESSDQKEEIASSFDSLLLSNPIQGAIEKCRAAGITVKLPLKFSKYLALELLRPRILVKDPLALLSAGWLYETYDFKVICMIRNPFAFVSSVKAAGWDFDFENLRKQDALMTGLLSDFTDQIDALCADKTAGDFIDRAILLWKILNSVILKYRDQYPNWFFVRHEDVVMEPQYQFQRIFDYLDLDLDSKILRYVNKYTSDANAEESTSVFYQPRSRQSTLYAWKEKLSSSEIDRIQAATAEITVQLYGEVDIFTLDPAA